MTPWEVRLLARARITVAQVTHYMPPHPGGIERVAETLFQAYRANDIEVEWIASRVPRDAPDRESGRRRVRCVNVLETALGVPVPIWGPGAARHLASAVRRAHVVHVHDCLYPGSALATQLARRYGRPVLLTQHVGFVAYSSRLLNACEHAAYATIGRHVLRQADAVVVATPAADAWVHELLDHAAANVSAIPNGIDLRTFRPADAQGRQTARAALAVGDAPVVMFAGRLVEKKGVSLVLDVARRLPRMHMLVIGDGPLAPLMRAAPPNVVWIPSVPPIEMRQYYHAADCLLLPSHGEGLPLVVQEALACGVPAVVPDDEPYAAVLARAGVVTACARDADALTAGVEASSAAAADPVRERARRYAEQHWDVETMTRRYLDLVRTLAARVDGERDPA